VKKKPMNGDLFSSKTLERALRVIEVLAGNKEPMRLQNLSVKAGIPESTVMRIVNTLAKAKYAEQDEDTKRYFLTFRLSYLGNLISSRMEIREIVRPMLVELSAQCGESSCLAIERNSMAVYIDYVDGPDSLLQTLHHIGREAPLHCTGVGKNLLLNYSAEDIDRYVRKTKLEPLTPHSISAKEQLIRELHKVKALGYAIDNEECELGVKCVAGPLWDCMGKIFASISVTGPASRMSPKRLEEIRDRVVNTAQRISTKLSGI
jgi:DNA-binding IclR family transcriptional regulator